MILVRRLEVVAPLQGVADGGARVGYGDELEERAQMREKVEVHGLSDETAAHDADAQPHAEYLLGHLFEGERDLVEILLLAERRDVHVDRALEQLERARAVGRVCAGGLERGKDGSPVRIDVKIGRRPANRSASRARLPR